MATIPVANANVEAARLRRASSAQASLTRVEWFIDEVSDNVAMSIKQRVGIATELVRSAIIKNISRPVTKGTGPRGGRVVRDRSVAGEFPKADTTQLMKTIFSQTFESSPGVFDGAIGTPLDYGLILELKMNRSFLVRTLNEQRSRVVQILTGPIV